MSPPSANTRSGRTPTPSNAKKDSPSTADHTQLSCPFSSTIVIRSPSEAKSTKPVDARKEILEVLMNPKAHKDPESQKVFSHKLSEYTRLDRADPSDILFQIGVECFGLKKYKVVLIGGAGVGKTSFVARHMSGKFQLKSYKPTHGTDVTSIVFPTSQGFPILLEFWDTAGVERNGSLKDAYYVGSDAAIMMYDTTSNASYKALDAMYKDLIRVCEDIPIVVTGNKVDDKKGRKTSSNNRFQRKNKLQHYELSAKSGQNIDQPLLYIARMLTGDKRLHFVTAPGKKNAELQSGDESDVATSTSQLSLEDRPSTKEAEVVEAKAVSLPPSKDDDGGL